MGTQVQAKSSTRLNPLNIPGKTSKYGTGIHKRAPSSSWTWPERAQEGATKANKGGQGTPVPPWGYITQAKYNLMQIFVLEKVSNYLLLFSLYFCKYLNLILNLFIFMVAGSQPWIGWWFSWNYIVGIYILKISPTLQQSSLLYMNFS